MKNLLALLLLVFATDAAAHGHRIDHIQVAHPWARATAASATNGVVYMIIENVGDRDDRLLGARTPMATDVQIHTHEEVDGVMQMRRIEDVGILAGESLRFGPGGLHLMLLGLKAPLVQGTQFPMTLVFDGVGEMEISVFVEAAGAQEPALGLDHGEHAE